MSEARIAEFINRCRELRNGNPNAFYAHVDAFCKERGEAEAPAPNPPEEVAVAMLAACEATIRHLWDIAARFENDDCNRIRDPIHILNTLTLPAIRDLQPKAGAEAPAPRPIAKMSEARYFRHVKGFNDGTDYIRCDPDGRGAIVLNDGSEIASPSCTLSGCVEKVQRGIWSEFTPTTPRPIAPLADDEVRALWRSVTGPHAELTGPLIRFAAGIHERAEQQITALTRTLQILRDQQKSDFDRAESAEAQAVREEAAPRPIAPLEDRCSQHPSEPFELVCVECFESDRTAAANERAERAERQIAALTVDLEAQSQHIEKAREAVVNAQWADKWRDRAFRLKSELIAINAALGQITRYDYRICDHDDVYIGGPATVEWDTYETGVWVKWEDIRALLASPPRPTPTKWNEWACLNCGHVIRVALGAEFPDDCPNCPDCHGWAITSSPQRPTDAVDVIPAGTYPIAVNVEPTYPAPPDRKSTTTTTNEILSRDLDLKG